jgi:hypothetical protein
MKKRKRIKKVKIGGSRYLMIPLGKTKKRKKSPKRRKKSTLF